jgi:4-diphosphocytidyl-2-C-methyl-D-erythritol kinase
MLTISAPAKLNLTLEVLSERQDGFHEICSVIQTIDLCDSFCFQLSQDTEFRSNVPSWIPEKSLVPKAVSLLRDTAGCSKGAMIEINHRIPLVSGLGGDSSNAVATLRGLNQLWELGLSHEKMLELASQLGSDVALFLYGGTALIEGRGEVVTPLPPLPHVWVIVVVPLVPRLSGKTEKLYASLTTKQYTSGQLTEGFAAWLAKGEKGIPSSLLVNVFDAVAPNIFPEIKDCQKQFAKAGAKTVHIVGSGPALYTLVEDKEEALKMYWYLQNQGLEVYLTETL